MMSRCNRVTDKDYLEYGGRGIQVCKRWHKFENFVADMGQPPPGMFLDRTNNDGNYRPKNCKWATAYEQARNTRRNHILEYNGERHCVSEWAEILGFDGDMLKARIQLGWSAERALTTPVFKRSNNRVPRIPGARRIAA
jgi:hypothetical protein